MVKQPIKQLTLRLHPETDELVVRSVEEGELLAYTENVGHPPNNLPKDHPAYKLWTYKNRRDGEVADIVAEYEKSLL